MNSRSPAVNAGVILDQMPEVDLNHKPRIVCRIPDMGCYEADNPAFTIIFR